MAKALGLGISTHLIVTDVLQCGDELVQVRADRTRPLSAGDFFDRGTHQHAGRVRGYQMRLNIIKASALNSKLAALLAPLDRYALMLHGFFVPKTR